MFYLKTVTNEQELHEGEVVMVLADFSGVPAGTKGIVCEIYNEGVMIAWVDLHRSGKTEAQIRAGIEAGNCYPAAGFDTDGFGREELDYLAVRTEKHPREYGYYDWSPTTDPRV